MLDVLTKRRTILLTGLFVSLSTLDLRVVRLASALRRADEVDGGESSETSLPSTLESHSFLNSFFTAEMPTKDTKQQADSMSETPM